MKVKVLDNQNIIDLCIAYYGSPEGLPFLLIDNAGLKPDSVIEKGTDIYVRENSVIAPDVLSILNRDGHIVSTGTIPKSGKTIITEQGDILLQENGSEILL